MLDASCLDRTVAELDTHDFDVVVVAQSMATPPAVTLNCLASIASRPLIVWALRTERELGSTFDKADVTSRGATVGVPMLTSVLTRTGQPFDPITASLADADLQDVLAGAVAAAAGANAVMRGRIGRLGDPIDGYTCVDLDPARLSAAIGTTIVNVGAQDFVDAFDRAGDGEIRQACGAVRQSHIVHETVDHDSLERAVRAKLALDTLVRCHSLDAGAFNCHVPQIRFGPSIGIAPCYALGCSTSEGVPWTCSGDVVTAVAMLAVKSLGAPALYHELEAFDSDTGVFVVANTGETDLGLLGPAQLPTLAANPWFGGTQRSLCSRFSVAQGPATLVGFAQLDGPPGHRFIVASGRFTDSAFPSTGTTNAGFAFQGADGAEAWRRWCLAGANHHGVLTAGEITNDLERLGRHLGVEVLRV